jgi:hypothetical protein
MYPIAYEADFNPEPSRGTTFFRLLLAIPWLIVGIFWGILYSITHVIAWIAVVILGRYPGWLYHFNSGVIRFSVRVSAWLYLQTDEWPPFGLSDDPGYPIRINIPPAPEASQSRLKALFRWILVLPVLFVLSYGTAFITLVAAFVAWLTIVFRGYLPEGVNDMLTFCHGFQARVLGYHAILTDEYPPIGLEMLGSAPVAPATSVPPVQPAA